MEHVFFPFDAELKDELDQIKLAIQGEQNGMASQGMGKMAYKKNYGVSYVSLRKIASQYTENKKLADCLWNIGYRETMLLALLLYPKNELQVADAEHLIAGMEEMELAEFACRDLFSKMGDSQSLVRACLGMDCPFSLEVAYLLAARLLENGGTFLPICDELFCRVEQDLSSGKSSTAKAVSNFLKQMGIMEGQTEKVMMLVDKFSQTDVFLLRWVAEEVRTFVEYR